MSSYSYAIRDLPPCKDWKGNEHPQRWGMTKVDDLGLRWEGGEYLTRDEAVAAGKRYQETGNMARTAKNTRF